MLIILALRPIPRAFLSELRAMRFFSPVGRSPLKPILSVLLAIAISTLLHLDDLVWSAFSGYMVMRGDIRETVPRGLMRIAGTILGAIVGLVLAPAVSNNPLLVVPFLFIVSWTGVFMGLTSRYSYAWLFFGLTAGMVVTDALSTPEMVPHFAFTRIAEIIVGTMSCFVVACLFAFIEGRSINRPMIVHPFGLLRPLALIRSLKPNWSHLNRSLVEHSTRAAMAVSVLPLLWVWFRIEDFSQTAITSYVVMMVPPFAVLNRKHLSIFERMIHRTLGCCLGSILSLVALVLLGTSFAAVTLVLCAGLWLGYHIQNGREGINYLGTQFALGCLTTLVQGPGLTPDLTAGIGRLLGIFIGSVVLCLVIMLWPLPQDD